MNGAQLIHINKNRVKICGDLTLDEITTLLKKSADIFSQTQHMVIDLAEVTRADSAGLALLIEWLANARKSGNQLSFCNLPPQIIKIGTLCEVIDLLPIEQPSSASAHTAVT